jgi:hypothetical protein
MFVDIIHRLVFITMENFIPIYISILEVLRRKLSYV